MGVIKLGVIGYGYWGPNLARSVYDLPSAQLVAIADKKDSQLRRAKSKYPGVLLVEDYRELFSLGLDAVIISTPPQTHFKIAQDCMMHDLHVLVEKPLTLKSSEAEELIGLASTRGLILMVGHTFEYNSAVQAMKKYIDCRDLGDLYYIDTARLNLGLFQRDSNVLWDLAPHDISILLYLLGDSPVSVSAQGMACISPGVYDVAYLNLIFPHNLTAYVHVSWLDPRKVRRVTVVGSKKMVVYNDLDGEGRIKIYDKGVEAPSDVNSFGEFEYNYRAGDIMIPHIHFAEPLLQECQHFIESVSTCSQPRSSGLAGLKVIKILEAAQRSLANGSSQEAIKW